MTTAETKLLLLAWVAALGLAGCQSYRGAGPGPSPAAASERAQNALSRVAQASIAKPAGEAGGAVRRTGSALVHSAREALALGDSAAAIGLAELAVRTTPHGAAERAMLARAYLAAGRLAAASQAYDDLLSLRPDDDRARLGRALTHLAQGSGAAALADLAQVRDPALVADLGLAYALAGDTATALRLLQGAVREAGATSRTRQNLALVLALDGQWTQARIIAAQDLAAAQIDARIRDWTALAAQRSAARAAALLGVTPSADDPGRPAALALGLPAALGHAHRAAPLAAGTLAAAAQHAPAVGVAPEAAKQRAGPGERASELAEQRLAAGKGVAAAAGHEPRSAQAAPARWVVQVGAYRTAHERDRNWSQLRRSLPDLDGRAPIRSSVAVGHSAVLHRLAVGDFGALSDAQAWCRTLRATGRDCFVRRIEAAAAS